MHVGGHPNRACVVVAAIASRTADGTAFDLSVEHGMIEECEQHAEYWDTGTGIEEALETGIERMAEGDPAFAHFNGNEARLRLEPERVENAYGPQCPECDAQSYAD